MRSIRSFHHVPKQIHTHGPIIVCSWWQSLHVHNYHIIFITATYCASENNSRFCIIYVGWRRNHKNSRQNIFIHIFPSWGHLALLSGRVKWRTQSEQVKIINLNIYIQIDIQRKEMNEMRKIKMIIYCWFDYTLIFTIQISRVLLFWWAIWCWLALHLELPVHLK